jgi:hypothetical protein
MPATEMSRRIFTLNAMIKSPSFGFVLSGSNAAVVSPESDPEIGRRERGGFAKELE